MSSEDLDSVIEHETYDMMKNRVQGNRRRTE